MQFVNLLWIGLFTIPQAFALEACTGQNFGYKALDPADPRAYYLCLGLVGKIRNTCAEGFRFDGPGQKCVQDKLLSAQGQNAASGPKNEFNINQNITLDRPIIFNIFGNLWNRPPELPIPRPTTPSIGTPTTPSETESPPKSTTESTDTSPNGADSSTRSTSSESPQSTVSYSSSSTESSTSAVTDPSPKSSTESSSSSSEASSSSAVTDLSTESSTESSSSSSEASSSSAVTDLSTESSTGSSSSSSEESSSSAVTDLWTESSTESSSSSSEASSSSAVTDSSTEVSTESTSSSSDLSTESSTESSSSSSEASSSSAVTDLSTESSTESSSSSSEASSSSAVTDSSTEVSTESTSSSSDLSTESSTDSSSSSSEASSSSAVTDLSTESSTESSSSSSEASSSSAVTDLSTESSTDSSSSSSEASSSSAVTDLSTESSTESSTSSSEASSSSAVTDSSTDVATESTSSSSEESSSSTVTDLSTESSTDSSSSSSEASSSSAVTDLSTESSTESSSSEASSSSAVTDSSTEVSTESSSSSSEESSSSAVTDLSTESSTDSSSSSSEASSSSAVTDLSTESSTESSTSSSESSSSSAVTDSSTDVATESTSSSSEESSSTVTDLSTESSTDSSSSSSEASSSSAVTDLSTESSTESSSSSSESSSSSAVTDSSTDVATESTSSSSEESSSSVVTDLSTDSSSSSTEESLDESAEDLESTSFASSIFGAAYAPLKLSLSGASFSAAGIEETSDCAFLPNGAYLRDLKSCNKFYVCANGHAISRQCPENLNFDIVRKICNVPSLVDCSKQQNPAEVLSSKDERSVCSSLPNGAYFRDSKSCSKFYICANGRPIARSCPSNLYIDVKKKICNFPDLVDCQNTDDQRSNSTPAPLTDKQVDGVTLKPKPSITLPNVLEKNSPKIDVSSSKVITDSPSSFKKQQENNSKEPQILAVPMLQQIEPVVGDNSKSKDTIAPSTKTEISKETSKNPEISMDPREPGFVSSDEVENSECSSLPNGAYFRDSKSCSKFYICANGRPIARSCPSNLYFDVKKKICNFPDLVDCQNTDDQRSKSTPAPLTDKQVDGVTLKPKLSLTLPNVLEKNSPKINISSSKVITDSPSAVKEQHKTSSKEPIQPIVGDNLKSKDTIAPSTKTEISKDTSKNPGISMDPREPTFVPSDEVESSECRFLPNGAFIRDSQLCGKFYVCANGRAIPRKCPGVLYFDIKKKVCNFPSFVDCTSGNREYSTAPDKESVSQAIPDCGPLPNGIYLKHPKSCSKFYVCAHGRAIQRQCPKGLYIDTNKKLCNFPSRVKCSIDEPQTPSRPESPDNVATTRPGKPDCSDKADGSTLRDPKLCNKYYVCRNGKPATHFCTPGKWFDLNRRVCAQKRLVDCGN